MFEFEEMLTIAERTLNWLVHPQRVEEMDRELTKIIEDFDRAVNVEALRQVKETRRLAEKTRKHSFISLW